MRLSKSSIFLTAMCAMKPTAVWNCSVRYAPFMTPIQPFTAVSSNYRPRAAVLVELRERQPWPTWLQRFLTHPKEPRRGSTSITPHKRSAVWDSSLTRKLCVSKRRDLAPSPISPQRLRQPIISCLTKSKNCPSSKLPTSSVPTLQKSQCLSAIASHATISKCNVR